ncbi:MAG: hypothetical protein ACXVBJ_02695 [Flavisolibacter sp.]
MKSEEREKKNQRKRKLCRMYLEIFSRKWHQRTEFEAGVARRNGTMRMSEFELLPAREQIAALYQHGIYIGKSKTGTFVKLLYQLDSFYVEIVYVLYRLAILKMHCTDSTKILDEYLEQIEIEYLVG